MKLWGARYDKQTDKRVDDFNSSIAVDSRMFEQDIAGSIAHATMLGETGIIDSAEAQTIVAGLEGILADVKSGALAIDPQAEDVHTFVEAALTQRIGPAGGRLHTARSRNDQVALDVRLYLKQRGRDVTALLADLVRALCDKAHEYKEAVMPGYTHLQRAQPVTFAHYLMAYAEMLLRDIGRFRDALVRADVMPLGSGALAGTTHPLDRERVAQLLDFAAVTGNSLDGVSDRDFALEALFCCSTVMMHLSRLCEELILWSSWEFKFISIDDAFTTGSSIMPQKKNPDVAELVRGKTGRVYGDLMALLTVMKGLPLAYNKDMQEDKEALFDGLDTVEACLTPLVPMIATLTANEDNMFAACEHGYLNATDMADYLARKGLPFRDAYKLTAQLVSEAQAQGVPLSGLSLEALGRHSELFAPDIYDTIDIRRCVSERTVTGGPAPQTVAAEIDSVRARLAAMEEKR